MEQTYGKIIDHYTFSLVTKINQQLLEGTQVTSQKVINNNLPFHLNRINREKIDNRKNQKVSNLCLRRAYKSKNTNEHNRHPHSKKGSLLIGVQNVLICDQVSFIFHTLLVPKFPINQ